MQDIVLTLCYNNNRSSWQYNAFSLMLNYLEKYRGMTIFFIDCEESPLYCDFLNLKQDINLDCMKCRNKKVFVNSPTISLSDYIEESDKDLDYMNSLPTKFSSRCLSKLCYNNFNIGRAICCSLTYLYQSNYQNDWSVYNGSLAYNCILKAITYYKAYTRLLKSMNVKYLFVDDINKVMWRIPIDIASKKNIKCIMNLRADVYQNHTVTYQIFNKLDEYFSNNAILPNWKTINNSISSTFLD